MTRAFKKGAAGVDFPERLVSGYRKFLEARLPEEQHRFQDLATRGQKPEIMVIGCCDSRVSPEVIFDAAPGELFVARNVANLVPPYSPDGATRAVSAALEFAVQALRVRHIVVLGHAQCGGIAAYHSPGEPLSPGDFIGNWMKLIEPAANSIPAKGKSEPVEQYLARLEMASAVHTLDNLMSFPCVNILAGRGKLKLHAAYFGVARGELLVYDKDAKQFLPVAAAEHAAALASPRF
jgi:carbonic anhydrase